jgi:carbamoyltransferase
VSKTAYIGLAGLPGLDPNPAQHIARYAPQHPHLGIALGDLGHDATAALVADDGTIALAVEEERLNRSKHYMGVPVLARAACQAAADADRIVFCYYLDPNAAHRGRRLAGVAASRGDDAAVEEARADFDAVAETVRREYGSLPGLRFVDHHAAHAASAFYPSGFARALVLAVDGQGESASISVFRAGPDGLTLLDALPIASSLGYFYSDVTAFLGFEALEDEYKVMGLAAYGEGDEFAPFFDDAVRYEDDVRFTIPSLLEPPMKRLYDWMRRLGPRRRPGTPIEDRHIAIACSLQRKLERVVVRLVRHWAGVTGLRALCLAGGTALNCTMNGVIDRLGLFDEIFVQPAANDPGAALGAALYAWHADHPGEPGRAQVHSSFGPAYTDEEIDAALRAFDDRLVVRRAVRIEDDVARLIAEGNIVGWFQGRMEFGPRALGNRSILADPRDPAMKDHLNEVVKKREEFRPFAPSVIAERAGEFFELRASRQYRFMNFTVPARAERRGEIPAVVHVNGTARVQLVDREQNPRYYGMIERFGELTGVPMVVNTSFNVRGEPIVCTARDAVACFLGTGIDVLALGDRLVVKQEHRGPALAGRGAERG